MVELAHLQQDHRASRGLALLEGPSWWRGPYTTRRERDANLRKAGILGRDERGPAPLPPSHGLRLLPFRTVRGGEGTEFPGERGGGHGGEEGSAFLR